MKRLSSGLVVAVFCLFSVGFSPPLEGAESTVPCGVCGDMDGDEKVNITDAVRFLKSLFFGGSEDGCVTWLPVDPACANVNGDKRVDIADGIYLLNWLFMGGPSLECQPIDGQGTPGLEGFQRLGQNLNGWEEYMHEETGIVFVLIPTGAFQMGSPLDECGRRKNETRHNVELSPFLLAKYELSQEAWERVMSANPSLRKGPNLPVESVTWDQIQDFNARTGLRLPTEAQWEYACRAGTPGAYSFGETISTEQANWNGEARRCGGEAGEFRGQTMPVTSFASNGFGLHNMHGNVAEFCEDVFDEDFYNRPEATHPDPSFTTGRGNRVIRGGGFNSPDADCRSASRLSCPPDQHLTSLGYRPAFWPILP